MKIPLMSLVIAASHATNQRWFPVAAGGNYVIAVDTARTPSPISGAISNLQIKTTPALTTGSYTVVLMVNGSASTLTATVSAGGSTASDTTHTVNVSAGDLLEWRLTPSSTPDLLTSLAVSAVFESNVARSAPVFCGHSAGTGAQYIPPGSSSQTAVSTEGFGSATMGVDGDFSYMTVKLTTAPGAGVTRRYTLRKNGVDDPSFFVDIADSATEGSVASTVSFTATDVVTIGLVNSGGVPASSHAGIGLTWNPTTNGYFPLLAVASSVFATTGTRYIPPSGISLGNVATESTVYQVTPYDMTVDNLYAAISTAPTGATKSRTFTLRTGGTTDTSLSTAIVDTAIANSDTNGAHAQTITAGTLISVSQVPANTPAAITAYNRVGMRGYITPTDVTGRTGMLLLGAG